MAKKRIFEGRNLTSAEKSRRNDDKCASIDEELKKRRDSINWTRRKKAEKSLAAWMNTYGIGIFVDDAPPTRGEEILAEMELAVGDSRPYQVLMARGHGKTSYVEATAAFALATGKRKFVVIVAANLRAAQQIMADIYRVVDSDEFSEDYPDICYPIEQVNGSIRRKQTYNGRDTDMAHNSSMIRFARLVEEDGSEPPTSGSLLVAAGIGSGIRGKKSGTLRPDMVILDDLQTAEDAANAETVNKLLSIIRKDVLNLGGKGKIATLMTATVIEREDLAEQISADKAWKTTTFPAMIHWPKDWMKDQSKGLWARYFEMFDEENAEDKSHGGSLSFYKKNRREMDEGAEVLNPTRFKRSDGHLSAIQALMDKMHEIGRDAFQAEYQMSPVKTSYTFEINPKMILNRVRVGTVAGAVPDGTVFTAAATDINPSYAISTAIARFDIARTCFVCNYFVQRIHVDSSQNDTLYHQKIYEILTAHGRAINGLGIALNAWGVDAGGKQFDPVTRFGQQSQSVCGIASIPMVGRAGRNWNPNVRTRIRNALNDTVFCRDAQGRVFLAWDADSYKEQMQRAWGTETGAPGGCSIFDGGITHSEFATQVSNERLLAKQTLLDGRTDFKWKTREPHDFGDCMAMLFALAGAKSISASNICVTAPQPAKVTAIAPSVESHAIDVEIGCDF